MAFLDSKKKEQAELSPISIDSVVEMKNRGYTNDQIFQTYATQGYSESQIADAINQADIKLTMEYPVQENEGYANSGYDAGYSSRPVIDKEKIEEIAESIIDEKWEEFAQNLDKIIKWKENTEAKLIEMDEKIRELNEEFDKVHNSIIGKVGEYDSNITNIGTTLKAMEQAFSKVLPAFVENVSELGRITKNMKNIQGQTKVKKFDS